MAGASSRRGYHRPSVVGMARSIGWLSMYVGLDFVHRRGMALAALARRPPGVDPGVTVLTPTHAMATLVTFRIAGWPAQQALDELGSRVFADRPDDPQPRRAADQRRLLQLRGGARAPRRGGRLARRAHARDAAAAPRPGDPGRGMTDRPDPTALPARRSWAEVRWRQFRRAPRPVVRAVAASLSVAIVLAVAYLAYDVALGRGAQLPGGDLRTLAVTAYVVLVLALGALITYLVVPQPTGSGTIVRRSRWSAALGFFAAVPDRLPRPGRGDPGHPALVRVTGRTDECDVRVTRLAHPYRYAVTSNGTYSSVYRVSGRTNHPRSRNRACPSTNNTSPCPSSTARRRMAGRRSPPRRWRRPFDPDELPIEAQLTDEEREFKATLPARAYAPGGVALGGNGQSETSTSTGLRPRAFSLRGDRRPARPRLTTEGPRERV